MATRPGLPQSPLVNTKYPSIAIERPPSNPPRRHCLIFVPTARYLGICADRGELLPSVSVEPDTGVTFADAATVFDASTTDSNVTMLLRRQIGALLA
jgi:hypothetical protein